MSLNMNRVYNPCRAVAPAPRSGCGENRNDCWSLKVFPLMAVLCDFTPERSPRGLHPPPPPGSHRFSFHPFARLTHLLLSLSRPPFSPLFQPHFTFIAPIFLNDPVSFFVLTHNRALYLSLVTRTVYLTSPTPASALTPLVFPRHLDLTSLWDGSLALQ